MPKKNKISRHAQYPAACREALLESERQRKFLGSARVPIDNIRFEPSSQRRQDHDDAKRLLDSFELGGCLRIGAEYHLPAVIDKDYFEQLLAHVEAEVESVSSKDPNEWPKLELPAGYQIECLHGKHRIQAGIEYLWKNDRWWVADFYSLGM
jgi:hypothetical protein